MAPNPRKSVFRTLIWTSHPPDLGPGPRGGVTSPANLRHRLTEYFDREGVASSRQPLVLALALLWHDCLEDAHDLAQQVHDADGSYVHGMMHRREPDYDNARYWFHRAGDHACFPVLGHRLQSIALDHDALLSTHRLVRAGKWDPFAFVDACEKAASPGMDMSWITDLQAIQALEFEVLTEHLLA